MSLSERQLALLAYCETPRTLSELLNHFQVSHMTVRRELETLMRIEAIKETPFRRGKAKQYKATLLQGENLGTYNIRWGHNSFPPVVFATRGNDAEESAKNLVLIPRFALATLLAEEAVEKGWKVPFLHVSTPSENVKKLVEAAIEQLQWTLQILVDLNEMPAWQGKEWINTIYGNQKLEGDETLWQDIWETLQEFTRVAAERGWEKTLNPELYKNRKRKEDS